MSFDCCVSTGDKRQQVLVLGPLVLVLVCQVSDTSLVILAVHSCRRANLQAHTLAVEFGPLQSSVENQLRLTVREHEPSTVSVKTDIILDTAALPRTRAVVPKIIPVLTAVLTTHVHGTVRADSYCC